MTPSAPSARAGKGPDEDAVRVPHWVVAALVMGGLHLLWLIWLVPAPAGYRASYRAPTRLAFLTSVVDGAGGGGDPRALWSPILLSLPTPMGFSGAVVSDELHVRPALDAPPGRARFLERERYEERVPDPSRHARDLSLAVRPAAETEPDPGHPPHPVPEPGLSTTFDPVPLEHAPWPPGSAPATNDWHLGARLVLDAGGDVRAVFLEVPSSDPLLNRRAARVLRRWRGDPGEDGRIIHVVLNYVAGPPAAAPPGEGGAP